MNRVRVGFALVAVSALFMASLARAAPPAAIQKESREEPTSLMLPATGSAILLERLGYAAESGDVDAMNLLGVLFATDAKEPSDYSMALYWFQKAADAGSTDAMNNMANMYLRGLGVARDYANAFRWFRQAADGGNALAMHSVAAMVEHGLGTPRDLTAARKLYRRAAEAGNAFAMLWLSEDLARQGTTQNLVEAYAWLEVAALSDIDSRLHVTILGRMEGLGNQLGPVGRDQARSYATQLVAAMRARAQSEATPMRASPASSRRVPSV